ncbi:MAG: haloacid dehalogenase-like hydrolase [Bdellovibrionaceae bacterium]|nr:haloacid dehalogenase-like hydrolase [Pseudobdellovibrionaceae bacterium]
MPQFNLSDIKKKIDTALTKAQDPVAVFDADGTVWSVDVGFGFFHYQVQQNLLPTLTEGAKAKHQEEYENLETRHKALLWLAQLNKGVPLATLQQWVKDYVASIAPIPFIPEQVELINYLQEKKVKVFIVTASVKWVVEVAAALLNIPPEQCIGVKTEVHDGIITDIQSGEITWGDQKLVELLKHTNGVKPLLASGNSMGDLALLENASAVSLAISKATLEDTTEENLESEAKLLSIAKAKGWFWLG